MSRACGYDFACITQPKRPEKNHGFPWKTMVLNHGKFPNHDHGKPWKKTMVFHGKKPWFSMKKTHGFPCLLNGIMEKNHGKCPNQTMFFFHEKPWFFPWFSMVRDHGFPWLETMVFHVCRSCMPDLCVLLVIWNHYTI